MKGIFKLITVGIVSMTPLLAGMGVGVYNYTDNVSASKAHPGSDTIPLKDVPMFIVLGFDDNGIADVTKNGGASWIRNFLKDKKNTRGSGIEETYDGSYMRASFYMTAKYGKEHVYESYADVRTIWHELYHDGHEIGNHSTLHLGYWDNSKQIFVSFDGRSYTKDEWLEKEINICHKLLTSDFDADNRSKGIGILESDLYGWRSPRLEWNNAVFEAIKQKGYVYDCSVESDINNDGKSVYWPFTLNNGHPFEKSISNHPGLWELPCSRFYIPKNLQFKYDGKSIITGLDYNVWITKEYGEENPQYNGPEFTEILNHTLDLRMDGNRAPMFVGLHSDIYSDLKDKEYPGTENARARQLAIENFIEYAVDTYPEVRIVSAIDVINWMRNPVPLDHENPISYPRHYSSHKNFKINSVNSNQIEFTAPSSGNYKLKIYSLKGTLLQSLKIKAENIGKNSASWDRASVHNGSYLFVVEGNEGKTSSHIDLID